MKLTWDEVAAIQTKLDQSYVRALRAYENAIASGAPAWLLAKPERIVFMNQPSVFKDKRGANIKPHYKVGK
jgi:hypothetical protein